MSDPTAKGQNWASYYAKTADRAPRPTLQRALELLGPPADDWLAVDLGCGGGRDTIELLRHDWHVLAIDAEADAITALRARGDLPPGGRLDTRVARFEQASWPRARLVNSSFALPLCPPEEFAGLWLRVVESIDAGGCFAGQFFGNRDSFRGRSGITTMTRAEAEGLLDGLDIVMLEEEEIDAVTPRGTAKHWHLFHIVARKPASR